MKKIELIGYSGHAFVVLESAMSAGDQVVSYYETDEKALNPYGLKYAGRDEILSKLEIRSDLFYFIGIGDNRIRKKLFEKFAHLNWINIIDPSAVISSSSKTGKAIYIGKNASVNALAEIGTGSIINTGSIIEHECRIGEFVHVAPGTTICGNVTIGENTLIGAGTVIRPGIKIGKNVIIGAGSVIVKDIPDQTMAYGSPLILKKL